MRKVLVFLYTHGWNMPSQITQLMNSPKNEYELRVMPVPRSAELADDNLRGRVSYTHHPIADVTISYRFDRPSDSKLADYDELVAFAEDFQKRLILAFGSDPGFNPMTQIGTEEHRAVEAKRAEIEQAKRLQLLEEERPKRPSSPHLAPFVASQSSAFFIAKPAYSTRVKVDLTFGVLCALGSIPLFFFEPISASMLALSAILLFLDAYRQHKQDQYDPQFGSVLI